MGRERERRRPSRSARGRCKQPNTTHTKPHDTDAAALYIFTSTHHTIRHAGIRSTPLPRRLPCEQNDQPVAVTLLPPPTVSVCASRGRTLHFSTRSDGGVSATLLSALTLGFLSSSSFGLLLFLCSLRNELRMHTHTHTHTRPPHASIGCPAYPYTQAGRKIKRSKRSLCLFPLFFLLFFSFRPLLEHTNAHLLGPTRGLRWVDFTA